METSLWSGQGESSYQYKVFFGDEYKEFTVDEKDITFGSDNPPENIAEFWDGLYKCIANTVSALEKSKALLFYHFLFSENIHVFFFSKNQNCDAKHFTILVA